MVVTELDRGGKALGADYENLAIAFEATGKFELAKKAFGKAIKANPDSDSAKAGLERVKEVLDNKDTIAKSGKGNTDTKFSK